MPKAELRPGKKHLVAVSHDTWTKAQKSATKVGLYVAPFIEKAVLNYMGEKVDLPGTALQNSDTTDQPQDNSGLTENLDPAAVRVKFEKYGDDALTKAEYEVAGDLGLVF